MDVRLPEGTLFGNYRIQGLIASGGMGQVYAAEHSVYGSAVALKVLHPALHADQGWRVRFNQEGLVGTQLKHPHVLSARELVEADGRIALVVDLVRGGQTLEKVVSREFRDGIALVPALRVFLRILQGMDYLHGKGIVHGDLKPENVMIEGDLRRPVTWTPKVTDFGTVALIAHPVEIDGRPAVVATPRYASPEHLYGVDRIEVRSDVYTLGLILHFLLSGRHASNAANVREAAERVMLPVPILNLVDLPEPAIEVFKKATAVDPDDRYESVRAMALAIRDVLLAVGADIEHADVAADIATEVDEDRAKQRAGDDDSRSQAATEPMPRGSGTGPREGDAPARASASGASASAASSASGSVAASTGSASTGSASTGSASTGSASTGSASTGSASTGSASTGRGATGPAPLSVTAGRSGPTPVDLSPDDVQEPVRRPTPVPASRSKSPPTERAPSTALPLVAVGLVAVGLVGAVLVAVAVLAFG